MQAETPSPFPLPPDELDRLHARYDGRPPRAMRLAALSGGDDVLMRQRADALTWRLRTPCGGALLAVARRRRQLPAQAVADDAWLCRLTAALQAARATATMALRVDAPVAHYAFIV